MDGTEDVIGDLLGKGQDLLGKGQDLELGLKLGIGLGLELDMALGMGLIKGTGMWLEIGWRWAYKCPSLS